VSIRAIFGYSVVFALSILIAACGRGNDKEEIATQTVETPIIGEANSLKKHNPDYLVVSAGAYHFDNFDERNAFTPGIGWEYSPSRKIGWHAGTLSDSFGYQGVYGGANYATRPMFFGKVRFLLGATVLHKQYKENAEPETKILEIKKQPCDVGPD